MKDMPKSSKIPPSINNPSVSPTYLRSKFGNGDKVRRLAQKARSFGKLLAEGSSRVVFDYRDGKVVKIAHNEAGISQNRAEVDIWNIAMKHGCERLFTRIYDHDDNFKWVVHSKAQDYMSTSNLNKALLGLYGYDQQEMFSLLSLGKIVDSGNIESYRSQENPSHIKYLLGELHSIFTERDEPMLSLVTLFVRETEMNTGDLQKFDTWGRDEITNLPVIRDYGMTDLVWSKYYSPK